MAIDSKIMDLLKSNDDANKLIGYGLLLGIGLDKEDATNVLLDNNQDNICRKCLDNYYDGQKYPHTQFFSCEGNNCEQANMDFILDLNLHS